MKKSNIINLNQMANVEPSQLYLRPDLSSALIELIKLYNWSEVYYIYNNDNGINYKLEKFCNLK